MNSLLSLNLTMSVSFLYSTSYKISNSLHYSWVAVKFKVRSLFLGAENYWLHCYSLQTWCNLADKVCSCGREQWDCVMRKGQEDPQVLAPSPTTLCCLLLPLWMPTFVFNLRRHTSFHALCIFSQHGAKKTLPRKILLVTRIKSAPCLSEWWR